MKKNVYKVYSHTGADDLHYPKNFKKHPMRADSYWPAAKSIPVYLTCLGFPLINGLSDRVSACNASITPEFLFYAAECNESKSPWVCCIRQSNQRDNEIPALNLKE